MVMDEQNFLQKLYSREIHGYFFKRRPEVHNKAMKLFGSIPPRLIYPLKDIFDGRQDQVLIGTSRCGQFLITYSYTVDVRSQNTQYKYRLHWYAFHGALPTHKVAEVQLFDCQDLTHTLHVGIAQWPNVSDRLIVYGISEEDDMFLEDCSSDANRKYYITVTTLPSLHNCRDCKAVAESFDEEDMAASWDNAVSFSCLKHGLTIHTTLDVAPPFPKFNPSISLKVDYKIIVNTGNFLHVLHFDADKEVKKSTEPDTIIPDEITHRTGEFLSSRFKDYTCPWKKSSSPPNPKTLSKSIINTWLNTIRDKANKVYAFEEPDDGCEPRFKWFKKRRLADKMYEFCSDDEDMENKCPPAKTPRLRSARDMLSDSIDPQGPWLRCRLTAGDTDTQSFVVPDKPIPKYCDNYETRHCFSRNCFVPRNQEKIELSEMSNINVLNSSICDSNNSNKCDFKNINTVNKEDCPKCDIPRVSTSEVNANPSCMNSFIKSSASSCETLPVSSVSEIKAVPSKSDQSNHIPHLEISVINPNLSAILAEWEADSVSSLSPKSDSLCKNDVIQSFLDLMPAMTISPRSSQASLSSENMSQKVNENVHPVSKTSSPTSSSSKYSPLLVVLRTRNYNQDELQKPKEPEKIKEIAKEEVSSKVPVKSTKEQDVTLRQRMISECSVRFDRIYIELDDEIISTISTDFEDDDTAFHDALPLSVHGSAYAQLQMVSRQKAERLSMDCERVFQTSLDIDNFCSKAAAVICQLEGYKFWHCSDFDVELIDICVLNCDILGVVCMRVNVEKPTNNETDTFHERLFCGINCVFIWNPVADKCWLEAYTPLVEADPEFTFYEMRIAVGLDINGGQPPAEREANRLRSYINTTSLFGLPLHPTIRTYEHRLWVQESLCPSIEELRDYKNLVGFVLQQRRRRCQRRTFPIAEFWD